MSKRAHLSFGLIGPVAAAFLLVAAGCGDDDGGSGSKDAGTSGKSGGGGSTQQAGGKGGSGGAGSGGSGGASGAAGKSSAGAMEGIQCTTTAECASGLTCVLAFIDESTPVRVCARACVDNGDCGKVDAGGAGQEVCDGYTDRASDKHCINLEPDAWAPCGVGYTSLCDNKRACLYFPMSTVGVCADLCQIDPTVDAGVSDLPVSCPTGNMCVPGVVSPESVGVCGKIGARGAECDQEKGLFCDNEKDLCIPDDLTSDTSPQHCVEDCTTSRMCTGGGTCTVVQLSASEVIRYCKK